MKAKSKSAAKPSKPAAKPAKAAPAKSAGKAAKTAKAAKGEEAPPAGDLPAVDPDELEEQEDAAASASGGGNSAALAAAAAGNPTEMSASFKNFRHHPDMENFYRFIYENDLRHEALAIIDAMSVEKLNRKMVKGAKTKAH
jgi:hypothetical protein